MNISTGLLEGEFAEVLEAVVNEQIENARRASSSSSSEIQTQYAVVLNNIQATADYVSKLRAQAAHEAAQLPPLLASPPPSPSPSSSSSSSPPPPPLDPRVLSGLQSLAGVRPHFHDLLRRSVDAVWSTFVQQRIRRSLEPFAQAGYVLTELNFAEAEIADPFMRAFIAQVDRELAALRAVLAPPVFQALLDPLVTFVAQEIERGVLAPTQKKRFNQFGGLQLDKELRMVQQYFVSLEGRGVRDRFSRLANMAALLATDSVADAADVFEAQAMGSSGKLSIADARRVLALRTDFDAADVRAFSL
jgi:conserved oligomeric Golgi complex subunit 4